MNKIFLLYYGKTFRFLSPSFLRLKLPLVASIAKLDRALEFRRNPRKSEYMENLARLMYPDFDPNYFVLVENSDSLATINWKEIEEIILLWPDANGTGWVNIERKIFRRKQPSSIVTVLNGRSRKFGLNPRVWIVYKWRRFLEKILLIEFVFLIIFMIITPGLLFWDFLRRRR